MSELRTLLFLLCVCLLQSGQGSSAIVKTFTESSGIIKEERHLNNLDTTYNVKVPSGKRAKLNFTSFLVLGLMPNCTQDSLEIFVGCQKESIGKFCSGGGFKPFDIYSKDECITLRFKTDNKYNGSEFEAKYSSFDKDASISSDKTCSNLNQNATGNLFSPLWPNSYPNNTLCTWKLTIPHSYRSKIYFMNFRIEDNTLCQQSSTVDDRVAITANDGSTNVTVRQRLCSNHADKTFPVDIGSYPVVYVTFFADDDAVLSEETGFAAGFMSYKAYKDGSDITKVFPDLAEGNGPTEKTTSKPPKTTKGNANGLSASIAMMIVTMAFVFTVLNESTK